MLVSYTPDGGDTLRWNYIAARVRQSKAEAVEKYFGDNFDAFNKAVLSGSAKARKVLLWHCLTGDHPLMKFADTPDFLMDEVVVEFDLDELSRLRAAIQDSAAPDDVKASSTDVIDRMIAELPISPKA